MPKSKKVKKSAQRPSDVTSFVTYGSRGDAVDEAVGGAHDRPDEETLLAEYHAIKEAIPDMSDSEAYARAARSAKASEVSKGDPLTGLADSLSVAHVEARRAGLSASQRMLLAKASREAELTYLRATRPWAVPDPEQIRKSESDALISKAADIRKADPMISEFQAMRRAAG